jgi:hypothetical protein
MTTDVGSRIVLDEVIPARAPWAGVVTQGNTMRIVDLGGNQAADTLFYNAHDYADRYSNPDTNRHACDRHADIHPNVYAARISDANSDASGDGDTDAGGHANADRASDSYTDGSEYGNADKDCHGDRERSANQHRSAGDACYAGTHRDSNTDSDVTADGNGDRHGDEHTYADEHADGDTHADACEVRALRQSCFTGRSSGPGLGGDHGDNR